MDKNVYEICNKDLKKEAFVNAQFISIAETGAMGEAGCILIYTSGGSIFRGNFVFGDIKMKNLYKAVPVLKDCDFGLFGQNTSIPDGWEYKYLGAGNHLIVRDDAYSDFKAAIGSDCDPSDVYMMWQDVAWNIIEKRNEAKHPLDTKTSAEMALAANCLLRIDIAPMTEEERVAYDLEAGYDPYEDERMYVTQELVHGDNIPKSIYVEEGFFTDGRSYMSEMWCWEHITSVTYYFPVDDPLVGEIPNDEKFIENYLIGQKKLIDGEEHPIAVMILDTDEGKVYSVTVSAACDDDYYCEAYM